MVTLACAFFEGSACGVTVMVTVLGLGDVTGAVYVAEVDTAPAPRACVVATTSSPQVVPLHPAPDSVLVSVAVADFVGSLLLVAVICTVGASGKSAGAV